MRGVALADALCLALLGFGRLFGHFPLAPVVSDCRDHDLALVGNQLLRHRVPVVGVADGTLEVLLHAVLGAGGVAEGDIVQRVRMGFVIGVNGRADHLGFGGVLKHRTNIKGVVARTVALDGIGKGIGGFAGLKLIDKAAVLFERHPVIIDGIGRREPAGGQTVPVQIHRIAACGTGTERRQRDDQT